MSTPAPSPDAQVQFLVNVQRLLADGQFVATYKYALLLAVADLAVERGQDDGDPLDLTTAQIADKCIHYYWRQCDPYAPLGKAQEQFGILLQSTGKQAGVVSLVSQAKRRHGGSEALARHDARGWSKLVVAVDRVVKVMPLWKLQTVGGESFAFLYENAGKGSRITLKPGIASCLRKFHGLVSDLVRGAWVRHVRRFNPALLGTATDLQAFLFGTERAELSEVAKVLKEVQENRCFYCRRDLKGTAAQVDHFIPWSRYPVDLGHNFVLAHQSCNGSKSDRLAAVEHLERWVGVVAGSGERLRQAFDQRRILHDLPTTLRITDWAYQQHGDAHGLTWVSGNQLIPLGAGWRSTLGRLNAN